MKRTKAIIFARKKAQAAVEMAIFGGVLLMVVGTLINYAETLTQQHHASMEAFRRALRRAHDDNGAVSYTLLKHKRNPTLGFNQRVSSAMQASASILWAKGVSEDFAYYDVDGNVLPLPRIEKTVEDNRGRKSDRDVPVSIYYQESSSKEDYSLIEKKNESNNLINTEKSSTQKDTIITKLFARFDWQKKSGAGHPPRYQYFKKPIYVIESKYNKTRNRKWLTPYE